MHYILNFNVQNALNKNDIEAILCNVSMIVYDVRHLAQKRFKCLCEINNLSFQMMKRDLLTR